MASTAARTDVWPAEIFTDPDAPDPKDRVRAYPVRVVATLEEILVWKDAAPKPVLIFRDAIVSYSPPIPTHRATPQERDEGADLWHVATTDSGHALSWKRAPGCGCGSKLKALSLSSLLQYYAETTPGDPANQSPFPAASAASINDK